MSSSSSSSSSFSSLISAITKRSSDLELDRLQTIGTLLLSTLKQNSEQNIEVVVGPTMSTNNNKKKNTDDDENKMLPSSIIIQKTLLWSNVSPRFIYLASPSKVIRSADRGSTWKSLPLPSILSPTTPLLTTSKNENTNNNNNNNLMSSTTTSSSSKPPKILKIASCSQTGAVAFCGTQGLVAVSLKIGGPFQVLTSGLKEKISSSSSSQTIGSLNFIVFDSAGLFLFVGNANYLFSYHLLSSTWTVIFSSTASSSSLSSVSSSSSSTMSISTTQILRESIQEDLIEIGIFFASTTSSSSLVSSSSTASSAILGKRSTKPTKTLQKVQKELNEKEKEQSAAITSSSPTKMKDGKSNQINSNNNNNPSELLVGGIGGLQLFQISRSSSSTTRILRKSTMIPHKLGSILQCQEIPIFHQNDQQPQTSSAAMRRFKWCSRYRPNQKQQQKMMMTSGNSNLRSKKMLEYDYTIGTFVPSSQIPFAHEFFSTTTVNNNSTDDDEGSDVATNLIENLPQDDPFLVTITKLNDHKKKNNSNAKKKKTSSSSDDSSDDDSDDEYVDIEDTFRGGFFPRSAPRLLACYSSGGRVVDSDATGFLWIWMGEQQQQDGDDDNNNNNDHTTDEQQQQIVVDRDAAAIYSTVTNVSYLPLVQTASTNTNNSTNNNNPVGLSVLDHGRSWLRCGLSGVSTSFDGGRNWTEPQLSCMSSAFALDRQSHLSLCSRPGYALLPELESSSKNTNANNSNKSSSKRNWNLVTLPVNLNCSVMSDGCVLE